MREASVDPMGVPQLGNATEHAEPADAALRPAQDAIATYQASIRLTCDASAPLEQEWRAGLWQAPPVEQDWRTRAAQRLGLSWGRPADR